MASLIPKPSTCRLPGFAGMKGFMSSSASSAAGSGSWAGGAWEDEGCSNDSSGWSSSMSAALGMASVSTITASGMSPSSESGGSSAASSAGDGGGIALLLAAFVPFCFLAPRMTLALPATGTWLLAKVVEVVFVFVLCLVWYLCTAMLKSCTKASARPCGYLMASCVSKRPVFGSLPCSWPCGAPACPMHGRIVCFMARSLMKAVSFLIGRAVTGQMAPWPHWLPCLSFMISNSLANGVIL